MNLKHLSAMRGHFYLFILTIHVVAITVPALGREARHSIPSPPSRPIEYGVRLADPARCGDKPMYQCFEPDASGSCQILNSLGPERKTAASSLSARGNNSQLGQCLESLQKQLTGGLEQKKRQALKIRSAKERAFLGFVLTCYGEAAGDATLADRMAIMKTMENRAKICDNELQREFTPMEIALQDKQYSMYNDNIYKQNKRGSGAFEAGAGTEQMKKCIQAFAMYSGLRRDEFRPPQDAEKITHYYAPAAVKQTPDWARKGQQVAIAINGEKVNSKVHRFYKGVHWSCLDFEKKSASR